MAQIITATAESTEGRVKLVATGGTVGDAFYVVRQDAQGSNLIRETTGDGVTWQVDPAATKKNLFKNPDTEFQTIAFMEIRRNYATNPRFRLPASNIAAGWSAYSSGTVTGTRVNDGSNGQFINTTSIAAAAKFGIVSGTRTFTATTRRVAVSLSVVNGTVEGVASANTIPAKIQVDFKLGATVVNTQTVTLPNWNSIQTIAYTGGASIDGVVTTVYLENTTGATVTAAQKLQPVAEMIEITTLARPMFHGSMPAEEDGEVTYAWVGTTDASASIQRRPGVNLCPPYASSLVYSSIEHGVREMAIMANGVGVSSYTTLDGGSGAIQIGMAAGKTYTVICKMRLDYALSGTQFSNGRRIAAITKVGAAASVTTYSNQAPNAAGTYDLAVTFDVPVGASDAYVLVYNGSAQEGDTVWVDKIAVVEGTWTGGWFDGYSENASWDGTANNSTSTLITAALPITMYDYEARQGFTTTYTITNELGVPDASSIVDIPQWGTWLKDPFRPFLNTRVLWHADSEYLREARREKLWARGAQFPVFHSDKRSKPRGTVIVGVETTDQAKELTSLLDAADTIMIDVDSKFGVPVRYVSVGDITGARVTSDPSAALSWEARYFQLQVDEVAMPIGAPVNQNLTYDQLAANFGSYISIPASVATYDDLAAGNWS